MSPRWWIGQIAKILLRVFVNFIAILSILLNFLDLAFKISHSLGQVQISRFPEYMETIQRRFLRSGKIFLRFRNFYYFMKPTWNIELKSCMGIIPRYSGKHEIRT